MGGGGWGRRGERGSGGAGEGEGEEMGGAGGGRRMRARELGEEVGVGCLTKIRGVRALQRLLIKAARSPRDRPDVGGAGIRSAGSEAAGQRRAVPGRVRSRVL